MADELDDEERAILEKHRASKNRDNFRVKIRQGDNEAELPYRKAREWLGKTFGIDLDEVEPQDEEPDAEVKSTAQVKRFHAGRRTG